MSIDKLSLSEVEELQAEFGYLLGNSDVVPEPLRKVLAAVSEYESKGKYEYMAICPAHDDHKPSLSVTWEPVSCKVLLNCFSCDATFKELVTALGLQESDLFQKPKCGPRKIVETYDYTDESGTMLYQKIRYEPKGFSQQKPDGNGGWTSKLNGVRRVLYNLVQVREASVSTVYIVEGEKDVDSMKKRGYVATTSGGTGTWRSEFAEFLRGRHVVIIPDTDAAGEQYMNLVIGDLLGVATDIKLIKLPHGKDVSDYFQRGGTEATLDIYIGKTPLITKVPEPIRSSGPTAIRYDEVEPEDVSWLWPERIPLGKLTLLAGEAGIGKSLLTLDIAARVSTGTDWPDGCGTPEVGSVLICTSEDDAKDTVVPRLIAAGADLSRISGITNVFDIDGIIRFITKTMKGMANVRLIILDPITEFLGNADSHKNAEVRRVLTPLCSFADKHNIAILGVTHYAKAERLSAANKIIGSIAFNATARQVWHVVKDGEQRLFVAGKANLTSNQTGLSYVIEKVGIESKSGKSLSAVRVNISSQAVCEDAQDVLNRLNRKPLKTDMAEDFLYQELADGPKDKKAIEKLAIEQDISEHTLRRARISLGVKISQTGTGSTRKSIWSLPERGE